MRILGGNFPSEDSSVDEKKTTEEVVLVKFFVVHGLKVLATEEIPFEPPRSSCGQEFRKMLPRKYLLSHRGAHVDRNSGENITEEYLLK